MDKKQEQLVVQGLKNLAAAANEPVFKKEDYELFKRCGLTPEEVKDLEKAQMMSNIVEILPDDEAGIQRMGAALGAISNKEHPENNLKNLQIIAERDPEMFVKLMALTSVVENEIEGDAEGK